MAALAVVKILLFAFLCISCDRCDATTTTTPNVTNTAAADVAIAALFYEDNSTNIRSNILPILQKFARQWNLGLSKTRIALIDPTDGLNVVLKLEDGVSIDVVNKTLEQWDIQLAEILFSDLRDWGRRVRRTIFPPNAAPTRPQIVILFVDRVLQSHVLAEDGADVFAGVSRTVDGTVQYDISGDAGGEKIEISSPRAGRIARVMVEMVRRLLKRCPFVKNVTDCFYNATRSCLAHVLYGGHPTGARYCLKEDPVAPVRCPVEGIEPCEETCNRLTKWTKCNATRCGQFGEQRRKANRSDPMVANCPSVSVKCLGSCHTTSATSQRRKSASSSAGHVAGVVLLSLLLIAVVLFTAAAILYGRKLNKECGGVVAQEIPDLMASTLSPITMINPPSLTVTPVDALANLYVSKREGQKSALKAEAVEASKSVKVEAKAAGVEQKAGKDAKLEKPISKSIQMETKSVKMEPKAAEVEPKAAKMEPKAAKMEPKAAKMEPKAAKMEPKGAKMEPKAAKMEPKAATVATKKEAVATATKENAKTPATKAPVTKLPKK